MDFKLEPGGKRHYRRANSVFGVTSLNTNMAAFITMHTDREAKKERGKY